MDSKALPRGSGIRFAAGLRGIRKNEWKENVGRGTGGLFGRGPRGSDLLFVGTGSKMGKGSLKGFLAFALRIHTCSQNLEDGQGKWTGDQDALVKETFKCWSRIDLEGLEGGLCL